LSYFSRALETIRYYRDHETEHRPHQCCDRETQKARGQSKVHDRTKEAYMTDITVLFGDCWLVRSGSEKWT
jgi:hypothetical protein